ncbi:TPA: CD1108 family mobile element protein [Streptococcus pneumoniae]|uniref:NlpC/P60 family protein n=2 Tax=Bacillota TaxID=1239 RepID=D6GPN8_FILAD|nr:MULTISPECIES: NlpC/P60 family protein [Bacteria]MBQ9863469.1 C40 family peptidase [Lachnospiraceae bacterium]MBS7863240.1 CHAP domain-containing protein [Streptococcus suis]ALM26465.1 putative endopeptidase p60 precursor [Streptococcus dysgalactiae subsp. equisimilis]EFE28741.1 NlpC/P60 family protein [Filifactor alocis ATCC 35896]EJH22347.1 NlpC/P60 domain protein [Streptococcus pneumoniae GA58981]
MEKKLRRDFKERQKIKEEAKLLGKEYMDADEAGKLKHGDDYRGKIIHEKDRFQDKIHEKESKRNSKNELLQGSSKRKVKQLKNVVKDKETDTSKEDNKSPLVSGDENSVFTSLANDETIADEIVSAPKSIKTEKEISFEEQKAELLKKRKMAEKVRKELRTEGKYSQNEEIYDPLGKDLDNDGIIDRYDNDFRDSDYFESTYDVEDNLHTKEGITEHSNKKHNAQKKLYKRKNYSDKVYTRKKEDNHADDKTEGKKSSKEMIQGREKKKSAKGSVLSGLAKGSEAVRDYLSHGSDENQGVETGEKIADGNSKLLHGIKNYADKKKAKKSYNLSKKDYKIRKRKSKLEFREAKEELKKTKEYKQANAFKKFQKKKQMKSAIGKRNKSRLRDRIKESLIGTLKSSKEMLIRKAKGLMMIVIGLIILGTFIIQFAGTSMTGMINSTSGVLTTTYLSDQNVLSEINQQFSGLEEGLQDEISSVEENYPGYDEYLIEKEGEIGHNTHELLSYITSRCGEIKDSKEVQSIIHDIFTKMYDLSYREEIEIRYRTVTETYTDEDGNEHTESHEEAYEYKKLIVTLKKREMDSIVREIFAEYPDNVLHYEALLASKGNMETVFGSGNGNLSEIVDNPDFSNPGIAFDDVTVKALFNEAEKHIGKRYVFGANGPNNFDCSSFVCWSFTHSGVKNMPRTTAWGIYKTYCNPVSPSEAKAGDIIFFKNTYDSGSPISHVGIYAGNGMMIHAGDPIRFVSINTPYWREHFYGFGRVK